MKRLVLVLLVFTCVLVSCNKNKDITKAEDESTKFIRYYEETYGDMVFDVETFDNNTDTSFLNDYFDYLYRTENEKKYIEDLDKLITIYEKDYASIDEGTLNKIGFIFILPNNDFVRIRKNEMDKVESSIAVNKQKEIYEILLKLENLSDSVGIGEDSLWGFYCGIMFNISSLQDDDNRVKKYEGIIKAYQKKE